MAFSTTTELAQLSEKELGHDTSAASTQRTDIVSWLDYAHKMVYAGGDLLNVDENGKKVEENIVFNFARSATPKSLLLLPAITNVTVTISRASNALTFSAAPDGSNSVAGYHVRIQNEPELYYISSHTGGSTSAVIEGAYVGTANASTADCALIKLRYDIGSSDILRLISPLQGFKSDNSKDRLINIVTKQELYKETPPDVINQGYPCTAGLIKESSGTYTIQMDAYPSDYELIECEYVAIPTTLNTSNSNPTIPTQFRPLLSYLACYFIGLRNNDSRTGSWLKMAQDIFKDMVAWDQNNVASIDDDYSKIKLRGFKQELIPLTVKAYS